MVCFNMLWYIMLCYVILFYDMIWYIMLWYVMSCHVVLCCVMLYYVWYVMTCSVSTLSIILCYVTHYHFRYSFPLLLFSLDLLLPLLLLSLLLPLLLPPLLPHPPPLYLSHTTITARIVSAHYARHWYRIISSHTGRTAKLCRDNWIFRLVSVGYFRYDIVCSSVHKLCMV